MADAAEDLPRCEKSTSMDNSSRYDVVVIGGGIMGSSSAYFRKVLDPSRSVCVVEPDATYELASTLRASGGERRLYSCLEHTEMSKFSIYFIMCFPEDLAHEGSPVPI